MPVQVDAALAQESALPRAKRRGSYAKKSARRADAMKHEYGIPKACRLLLSKPSAQPDRSETYVVSMMLPPAEWRGFLFTPCKASKVLVGVKHGRQAAYRVATRPCATAFFHAPPLDKPPLGR